MSSSDDFDHSLSAEEPIVPSSGFAASVMAAIQLEVAAPPPLPFPWLRVAPSVIGAVLLIAGCAVALTRTTLSVPVVEWPVYAESVAWSLCGLAVAFGSLSFATLVARSLMRRLR